MKLDGLAALAEPAAPRLRTEPLDEQLSEDIKNRLAFRRRHRPGVFLVLPLMRKGRELSEIISRLHSLDDSWNDRTSRARQSRPPLVVLPHSLVFQRYLPGGWVGMAGLPEIPCSFRPRLAQP